MKKIINKLLDKYEKSSHFKGEKSNRKVKITLCNSEFDDYNSSERESIDNYNNAVKELKTINIVDFDWIKGRENYLINNIWLVLENIDKAYEFAEREKRSELNQKYMDMLLEYILTTETQWIKGYYTYYFNYIKDNKKTKDVFSKQTEDVMNITKALNEIDKLKDNITIRAFSVKCYNDSKVFENKYKNFIVQIIKKYCPIFKDNYDINDIKDYEILYQVGIITMPETFEFCGNIKCIFENNTIDFSVFKGGASINANNIELIKDFSLDKIRKILFIENKNNYYEYILNCKNNDELVFFHGGFYSPLKGKLIKKIVKESIDIEKFFWGDIDLGGFQMFLRLKENIINDLKPYNMGVNQYLKYLKFGKEKEKKYLDKLYMFSKDNKTEYFDEVIKLILDNKKIIEQESFIIDR